jgi:hypothetical protein
MGHTDRLHILRFSELGPALRSRLQKLPFKRPLSPKLYRSIQIITVFVASCTLWGFAALELQDSSRIAALQNMTIHPSILEHVWKGSGYEPLSPGDLTNALTRTWIVTKQEGTAIGISDNLSFGIDCLSPREDCRFWKRSNASPRAIEVAQRPVLWKHFEPGVIGLLELSTLLESNPLKLETKPPKENRFSFVKKRIQGERDPRELSY